jgi:type 1 glutamine amidotransferase
MATQVEKHSIEWIVLGRGIVVLHMCVCAGFRQFLASNHPTFSVLGDVKHPNQGILEYSTQILLTQPCFKDWAHFISHIRHIGLRCVIMSPCRGDQKMRADISFQL